MKQKRSILYLLVNTNKSAAGPFFRYIISFETRSQQPNKVKIKKEKVVVLPLRQQFAYRTKRKLPWVLQHLPVTRQANSEQRRLQTNYSFNNYRIAFQIVIGYWFKLFVLNYFNSKTNPSLTLFNFQGALMIGHISIDISRMNTVYYQIFARVLIKLTLLDASKGTHANFRSRICSIRPSITFMVSFLSRTKEKIIILSPSFLPLDVCKTHICLSLHQT